VRRCEEGGGHLRGCGKASAKAGGDEGSLKKAQNVRKVFDRIKQKLKTKLLRLFDILDFQTIYWICLILLVLFIAVLVLQPQQV